MKEAGGKRQRAEGTIGRGFRPQWDLKPLLPLVTAEDRKQYSLLPSAFPDNATDGLVGV
ncbi:hypothetical protein [Calothrix sp. PCC 6303]|uniref:hypothetical protein n=1 Tax=Calothrix sp. PCC 6303 TaxID=1170562 RepID=UPI0002A04773|nr:hypothetical protein [Calothrix sp. PCC 6303]AFZ02883.1 hypothetical protein Cal6303_3967 [Calothrix sp. PCC 6303]